MKPQKKKKLTILDVVAKILDSDLPLSTRNEITRHYMLPRLGEKKAIIEQDKISVGAAERPSAEDILINNNPRMKEEFEDTERLLGKTTEDEDEEDE